MDSDEIWVPDELEMRACEHTLREGVQASLLAGPLFSRNYLYWYQGRLHQSERIEMSIFEPAFLYGATVFTTLRVFGCSLEHPATLWQAHCDRVRGSVAEFNWTMPDWSRVQTGAKQLCHHYPVLRLTFFPDGRELILGRQLPPQLAKWQEEGVIAWLAPPSLRAQPLHKTGNYLSCWQSKAQAQAAGAQEAILQNEEGQWLETSTGNLWGWHAGQWWTPPLAAGILAGIQREAIKRQLASQNQSLQESRWYPELVEQFDYLAYSNSVVGMIPIREVRSCDRTRAFELESPPRLSDQTTWSL
ncbi:MAG: aminotransferase class IV [Cyanobacteria bacterium P01_H01_bin.15]